jgi:malonate-semialdehyde dehydrogenase (acetylating)/methylmalonate-semialdehyde dehydrogenase
MTTTALETVAHWIGGERLHEASRYGEVTDPATGAVTRRVAFASAADVDRAVAAATQGFETWSAQSLTKRSNVLFRFRELLAANAGELARVITAEHGKTVDDARGEVQRGLEVVEFACGAAHLLKGEKSESVATSVDSHSLRQPLGVAVGITPFNFPAMVPMWMFPLALACGNAFILKPSEKDPSASLLMAEWLAEAGLPDGAFNVVHGDREAVEALLTHPGVDSVSFVGSTPVARFIYETATTHGKRVQALGGAKNHAVVMPDADVEIAADAIASAAYGSAGQRCMAISAVVAVGPAGDALAQALEARVDAVRVGPGADGGSQMGPLVTGASRDRVLGAIETGVGEGGELRRDGRGVSVAGHDDGFWVGPTLFDRVTPEMTIYRDEIFGPVLILLRADTFDEALKLVNRNPYGNGAAIFTSDGRTAREFEQRVQVGMVGVNVPIPVPMAYYSFGGWKQSLFGDLHVHGREGVLFYTRGKVVTERWPEHPAGFAGGHRQARGADYGFPAHK